MKQEINYKKENWKIQKHMEIKQHDTEQPMVQRRNQKKKFLNILRKMKK